MSHRKPSGTDTPAQGGALTGGPPGTKRDRERANTERIHAVSLRLAALVVWRQCDQHRCTSLGTDDECIHWNHRRDVDYAKNCLAQLGLNEAFPVVDDDDRRALLKGLSQVDAAWVIDENELTEEEEE